MAVLFLGALIVVTSRLVTNHTLEKLLLEADRHLRDGNLAEAGQVCTRLLVMSPDHPQCLMLEAAVAARGGAYQRAKDILKQVLRRDPGDVQALYFLGEVHRRTGEYGEATKCLTRGLQMEFSLPVIDDEIEFWHFLVDGIEREAPVEYCQRRREEFRALGAALEGGGVLRQHERQVRERIAAVNLLANPDAEIGQRMLPLLGLAGFSRHSASGWNRMLFEHALLPWMKRALAAGRFDVALTLEATVLVEYVAQTETEAHFGACVRLWAADMQAAGRRFGQGLPALRPPRTDGVPRVAFFAHQLSHLAHVRMMLDVLEGHALLGEPLITPLIACLRRSRNPAIVERIRRLGIEVIEISKPGVNTVSAADLRALREALTTRRVNAIVWVSQASLLSFAFGMRVAPVQIWWAMKYHNLELPEIDGYLTAGSLAGGTRRIDSRDWHAGPVAAEDWYDPQLATEATAIRATYAQHRIVFGCFGREEKLNSGSFLDAVSEILRSVPAAGFLWTGRQQHREIQARFDAADVAERCHFIGWVNTRLYAQVIDVFLDSFPFPCGFTLYESMAAAKPVVFYASDEAAETGARSMIEPLLLGDRGSAEDRDAARAIFRRSGKESLYLCAQTSSQYVSYAIRLAADETLRQQVGAAGREFVARFMSDRKRLGRIYAEHLVAIVREAEARRAAGS